MQHLGNNSKLGLCSVDSTVRATHVLESLAESKPRSRSGLSDWWLESCRYLNGLNVPGTFVSKLMIACHIGAERGGWWDTLGCPVDAIPGGNATHREEGLQCVEVVWAKSYWAKSALPNEFAGRAQVPAVWQGSSFGDMASFGGWACNSQAGEVGFVHGCLKLNCSTKAKCMA